MRGSDKKRNIWILLVSLLTPLTYLTLYYLRSLDDNRLSSWGLCFEDRGFLGVFAAVSAGVVISYIISVVPKRLRARGIILFLISLAASAFFMPEPEVIVDAARYFTEAKYLELHGIRYFLDEWGRGIGVWTDMPLVPFIYGIVLRFIGESRIYLQLVNAILYSLSTVLTYLIGKELWDEDIGFYGGLLLLGMPYLYTQVPLLLVDIATMFFLLLAVLTFLRALRYGGPMIVISGIAISLAFFSKYSAWLMLSVLPVAAAVVFAGERSKSDDQGAVPAVMLRTFYIMLVAALVIGSAVTYKYGVFSDQMKLLISYQKPGLKRFSESFVSTFFFQIHPFVTAAALYSVFAALRRRDLKYVVTIWLVVIVFVLQIERIRYIITVLPMFSLAASYGLCEIESKEVRRFLASCAVVSSFFIALFAYLPCMERFSAENIRDAGKFLDSLHERNVEVFTLVPKEPVLNPEVSVPLLDLFTRKKIIYDGDGVLSRDDRDKIMNSSLRFTVEYRNPPYYLGSRLTDEDKVIAVISESADDPLPPEIQGRISGYRLISAFDKYEGAFRYRTSVRVYERDG